jgi:tRNA threonylcarbamoyladenosine biosynthesis protein TsaB
MNRLLLIHTALETALTGLSVDGEVKAWRSNPEQRDHAAFLHTAIEGLLKETGLQAGELDAIAVVGGPGSYTGLRVGLSAAKGLCFALAKPLITLNTLEWMSLGVPPEKNTLRCPMIDARRSEVFTALFDANGDCRMETRALVLDDGSFREELNEGRVQFFGNGAAKWRERVDHPNTVFTDTASGMAELAHLAHKACESRSFTDLATAEPFYAKAFHSVPPR